MSKRIHWLRLSLFLALLILEVLETVFSQASEDRQSSTGRLIFTDINPGYTVNIFDLETDTRQVIFKGVLGGLQVAPIEKDLLFVDACFGINNPLVCSAYVRDIVTWDGFNTLLDTWTNEYLSPVWSPDWKSIAFIKTTREDSVSFQGNVHLMNADGTDIRDLTPEDDDSFALAWSPDSTRLVFDCASMQDLCFVDRDGSNLRRVDFDGDVLIYDIVWSSDGKSILITDWGNFQFLVVNADGSSPRNLLEAGFQFPTCPVWSHDSTQIAFLTDMGPSDKDIYAMRSDGTMLRNLTQTPTVSEVCPVWSPDNTQIAYFSTDGFLNVINADGSNLRRLTDNQTLNYRHTRSPFLAWLP